MTRAEVARAIEEHDRLGPERLFAACGFGRARTHALRYGGRSYDSKAILGTAYRFATGQRLDSGDFEGDKHSAVAVLRSLGFESATGAAGRAGRITEPGRGAAGGGW